MKIRILLLIICFVFNISIEIEIGFVDYENHSMFIKCSSMYTNLIEQHNATVNSYERKVIEISERSENTY